MSSSPVQDPSGLVYLADGSPAYAGRHVHESGYPVHSHGFLEIAVVVAGSGVHHCVTGRQRLSAGDVLVLRPGVWHGYEDCEDLALFNCCLSAGLLHRELLWMLSDPVLGHLLWAGPSSVGRRGILTARLEAGDLAEAVEHLSAVDRLKGLSLVRHRSDLVGRMTLFLGLLARTVTEAAEPGAGGPKLIHPVILRAMRMFDERLAHPWTLAELAAELHLVPGSLVRLFTTSVGLPPIAYLSQRRAEVAATLLQRDDRPIARIGELVGWPDPNYFARRFRAHLGMNASTYRRLFRH
ncbi:AraC family transcriptional regulator [Actinoplanes sp. NPDC048796]|uniref:AraC family transcriptional regulator n=1 Tax=Actinoplanes sp. NPDC048796 TaxID=3155640 RepID=UPI00340D3CDC